MQEFLSVALPGAQYEACHGAPPIGREGRPTICAGWFPPQLRCSGRPSAQTLGKSISKYGVQYGIKIFRAMPVWRNKLFS